MWQQLNAILAHIDVYQRATKIGEATIAEESRRTLAQVIGKVCASGRLNKHLGLSPEDVQTISNGGDIPAPFLLHFEKEVRDLRDNAAYYVGHRSLAS